MSCSVINAELRRSDQKKQSKKDKPAQAFTHSNMVEIGAKWLFNKGYRVVLKELVTSIIEIPDCLGFRNGHSFLLEAKVSRSDFLSDSKKSFRREGGPAGIGTVRSYICPKGLISPEELPENWGLVYVYESGRPREIVRPKNGLKTHLRNEIALVTSVVRRFIDGFEYKKYLHQATLAQIQPLGAPPITGCSSGNCLLRNPPLAPQQQDPCTCLKSVKEETASEVVDFIGGLKHQIRAMRNCANCVRHKEPVENEICLTCGPKFDHWVWEMEKIDEI